MNIFKKAIKEAKEWDDALEPTCEPTPPEEEWVWVEGYKGTDRNMCCRGFQYEMGKQFNMYGDEEIKECYNGFHLCLDMCDVFNYYNIGIGNRFFRVQALVRKSDEKKYGQAIRDEYGYDIGRTDKIVAKSIIFLAELSVDEILKDTIICDLPEQYKYLAIETNVYDARYNYQLNLLVEDGYSTPFATHLAKANKFDIAHAIGSQKDLSMDMKVLYILNK
jgi:hypothetical protein